MSHRRFRQSRGAFTLIELLAALIASGVLVVGLGSTLMLASRTLPGDADGLRETVAATDAADRMLADLAHATSFSRLDETATAFEVADRDGDNQPESLEYAWSGEAGDPLTLSINGATPMPVVADVRALKLGYDAHVLASSVDPEQTSGQRVVGFEQTVSNFLSPGSSTHYAQTFTPDLGENAISWSVDAVELYLAQDGGLLSLTSVLTAELREASGDGTPAGTALTGEHVASSRVSSTGGWVRLENLSAEGLDPSGHYAITLEGGGLDPTAIAAGTYSGPEPAPGAFLAFSSDGGSSWDSVDTARIRLRIEATVISRNDDALSVVRGVSMQLAVGRTGAVAPLRAGTRVHAFAETAP